MIVIIDNSKTEDVKEMFFSFLGFSLIFRIASGYVVCPYCDPNHVAYPNLEETCRGYDVPMGNPNPGNKTVRSIDSTVKPA